MLTTKWTMTCPSSFKRSLFPSCKNLSGPTFSFSPLKINSKFISDLIFVFSLSQATPVKSSQPTWDVSGPCQVMSCFIHVAKLFSILEWFINFNFIRIRRVIDDDGLYKKVADILQEEDRYPVSQRRTAYRQTEEVERRKFSRRHPGDLTRAGVDSAPVVPSDSESSEEKAPIVVRVRPLLHFSLSVFSGSVQNQNYFLKLISL